MITSNVQALMVVESDQDVKFSQKRRVLIDVKNIMTSELRSVGRSSNVSKELPMSASVTIERGIAISTWSEDVFQVLTSEACVSA